MVVLVDVVEVDVVDEAVLVPAVVVAALFFWFWNSMACLIVNSCSREILPDSKP